MGKVVLIFWKIFNFVICCAVKIEFSLVRFGYDMAWFRKYPRILFSWANVTAGTGQVFSFYEPTIYKSNCADLNLTGQGFDLPIHVFHF